MPPERYQYEVLVEELAKSLAETKITANTSEPITKVSVGETASTPTVPPRQITRLEVFDFDSTLFRSPLPNKELWSDQLAGALISDCGWFQEPRTLLPPYISECPDESWWHEKTISNVLESFSRRQDTLSVLLTGRRYDRFGDRIKQMCKTHDPPLDFDLFFFREGNDPTAALYHSTTLDFKLAVLHTVLSSFRAIRHVEFHDDRKRHLELFASKLQKMQNEGEIATFDVHHVLHAETDAQYMPPDLERQLVEELVAMCNGRILSARQRDDQARMGTRCRAHSQESIDGSEQDVRTYRLQRRISASLFRDLLELTPQVRYTGIVLDDNDALELQSRYPPAQDWSPRYHHVTVCMGPSKEELVEPMGGVGARVSMKVVAYGQIADKVTAVKVEADSDSTLVSDNETPHITLAVAPGAKAQASNTITQWIPLATPFVISGTIQEKGVIGLKTERGPAQMKKKDVSIGELIKKHHPKLQGRQIGLVVKHVEEWMEKTFIENLQQNCANIEWHIQGLDTTKLVECANGDSHSASDSSIASNGTLEPNTQSM
ncbi:hypothetical protein PhCBS80983_g01852 [Powellomyces hirtus]|uniref:Swiss Army Knife RNA repair protein HAD domain-containing protein n=1 Tax=Powellomyces hirtus TaxID=109895 RepID=A0A507EAB3_9FUNG|nr:hypothetical protein PhCBS80983_g01852 [Powellomyces hirtus]